MTGFKSKTIYLNSLIWLLVFAPFIQLFFGIYQIQIAGDLLYWGMGVIVFGCGAGGSSY